MSTRTVQQLGITPFVGTNELQQKLAVLSREAHEAARRNDEDMLEGWQEEIDLAAAAVFEIGMRELTVIQAGLS